MVNHVQAAGDASKPVLGRFFSAMGILSSIAIAFFMYVVLWKHPYIQYIPDLSSPSTAMREIGQLAIAAIGYLAIQFIAMLTRSIGRAWAELLDLLFSFIPLFAIYGGWTNMTSFTEYQLWAMAILGSAAVADIVIVTVALFRLLLMANDAVIR